MQIEKQTVSAEEIQKALNEALSRRSNAVDLMVTRIVPIDLGPSNWDAQIEAKDGEIIDPECKRVMLAAKLDIQNRFELTSD